MPLNEYGEEYTPLVSEPMVSTGAAEGSSFNQFFGNVTGAFQTFAEKFSTRPTSTQNSVSGALYNAIYAYGAGKLDAARESAARALLASRSGSQYVAEVEKQRLMQRLPVILITGAILFGAVFLLARR